MISNKYLQLWIDISWLLSRNLFAVSAGKHRGEYTAGDVIRLTVQSICKMVNQYGLKADKICLLNDKWAKEFGGYYRTYLLGGKYKDDRVYIDNLYVENLRSDPNATPEDIQKAEDEAYGNQVRMEAKYAIMNELHHFGFASIMYEGLEFDDLAVIASMMYSSGDITNRKPCCIVTKDSDLLRAVSPLVHFFKYPRKGETHKIWTYEEALLTVPEKYREKGVSLYWYNCLLEALGAGHNNARSPRKKGSNVNKVMDEIILNNDYSSIEDRELFDKTMQSFDFSTYPMFPQVQEMIQTKFMTTGRVGTLPEFRNFCIKHGVEGISDSYISNYFAGLDRSMYLDPAPSTTQKMF